MAPNKKIIEQPSGIISVPSTEDSDGNPKPQQHPQRYVNRTNVTVHSFQVGHIDPLDGNTIVKIYLKKNDYVLYDIRTDKKEDSLQFWQSPDFKDTENETLYPVFYHLKSELSRVKGYPNFMWLKYEAIQLFSDEKKKPNDSIIHLFSRKISTEIKYQTRNKQTYILTGLLFSLFMLLCGSIIVHIPTFEKEILGKDFIYIFFAATMGTLGGYFSILRKINDFFLIGEDARCNAILLALSRLLISAIAGVISFLLIRAGLFGISDDTIKQEQILLPMLAATNEIDIKTLSLILIAAFAAGFSETLIPQFMQSFENKSVNQPKSKNG